MTVSHPDRPHAVDHWVRHPLGRLFARSWTPPGDAAAARAPIVLFHDSLGSVELWRDFPGQLAAATGRRVVAYDRLGFGRSDARQGPLAIDFIADEARAFFPAVRDGLGLTRFVAFGHSVGGGMAINVAAALPGECVGLVTEAAQTFPENRTLESIRAAQAQFADAGQFERLTRYHGGQARWVLDAWIGTWLHPDFSAWSLAEVLPRVSCPALAIHGSEDEYGSAHHPRMIGERCGGPVRVELLDGIAHVPHREQAERVLALVAGFVAALP